MKAPLRAGFDVAGAQRKQTHLVVGGYLPGCAPSRLQIATCDCRWCRQQMQT
jgi:hypothetical protein